ncbi:MAG: alpha-hydroxy-acid oxidizing protein [Bacteroidota bacterium]
MKSPIDGLQRQRSIYLQGISGIKPSLPISLLELEKEAKKIMSPEAFAYVATGAANGETVKRNRTAFQQFHVVPRMLKDVSDRKIAQTILGQEFSYPLFLSPVGVLEMADKKADLAVAAAAEATRTPYIFSSQASVPMEKVAKMMPYTPKWFQLYWSKSNELVASFVKRAEDCGCSAIVVTLDTTLLGWRTMDLDLAYSPFLRGMGIAQYTSDPVFQQLIHEERPENPNDPPRKINLKAISTLFAQARNIPGGFFQNLRSGKSIKSVQAFTHYFVRPNLNWENLEFLKSVTKLPIILKGIIHPDDAQLAIDYGVQGIIVSNHGGRQVEGSVSTFEMLPSIVERVGGKIPVMMDSGIRSGSDMMKAVAKGALATGIGRPYMYALALSGQKGVEEVILNLKADFELNMSLSGCASLQDIRSATFVEDKT